jgi:hypothetical protein
MDQSKGVQVPNAVEKAVQRSRDAVRDIFLPAQGKVAFVLVGEE